jgi:hypothetical protein
LQAASRNGHNGHDTDAPGVEPSEQDLAVFEKRLAGHSVYSIAKQMNLPVKEVDAAIDRACTPIDDDFRLRTINSNSNASIICAASSTSRPSTATPPPPPCS